MANMWKVKLFLMLVLLSCVSGVENTGKAKVTAAKDQKELKGKRDAPTSAPYLYEQPQKTFHSPTFHIQPQQPKYTNVEHYTQQHKVAPLEFAPKQEIAQPQPHEQYHPTSFVAPSQIPPVENLFESHPVKEIEDFSFGYPHESFSQYPGMFGEYDKVFAFPIRPVSDLKSMPYYSAPQAYSYPQHSYSSFAAQASIPTHYTSSFTQSPGSLFIPQTVSIMPKPVGKVPDYAKFQKGLSHFSTLQPITGSYTKQQSYEVPSYLLTQTERPFKPSAFLGASVVPSEPYKFEKPVEFNPSKNYYVSAKEQYGVPLKEPQYHQQIIVPQVPKEYYHQYAAQAAPIEYHQVQYVQYPTTKSSHLPAAPMNSYLPPQKFEAPKNSYIPTQVAPKNSYLPAKIEKPKNTYLPPVNNYLPPSPQTPPSNSYLPPNNPYSSHQQSSQENYGSAEYHYSGHK